jgi:succinate dehydrogenase / fumarate reductase membrane anchor subunit
MLNISTALGHNGFQDWLLQRVTAIILAVYTMFCLGFWLLYPEHDFVAWHELFKNVFMSYGTILALLSLAVHAWIGMWTIITDYIKNPWLRFATEIVVFIVLLFDVIWGLQILTG